MIAGTASPETDVPNATYRNHGTHAEAIDLAVLKRLITHYNPAAVIPDA